MKPRLLRQIHPTESAYAPKRPKDVEPALGPGGVWRCCEQTSVAILTIPERPDIHATLAGLLLGGYVGDLALYCGKSDCSHLDNYRQHARIQVIGVPESDWEPIACRPAGWLACYNYWRALGAGDGNILVIEDDVAFHDNWFNELLDLRQEIERDYGHSQYGLSLYSPTQVTAHTMANFARFPADRFAGMQCFFYPHTVVGQVRNYMWDALFKGMLGENIKPDVVVGWWFDQQCLPIFTPKHSLVQHVGRISSMGSIWHRSPTFEVRDH